MFELIAAIIALCGSTIAALWDLFTTEVPDELLAIMLTSGIGLWYFYALTTGDFIPLAYSLVIGGGILVLGLVLYERGHWGGADAWLLAAIAFLLPFYNGIFMYPFIFNFLIVGTAYMIVYALVLGLINKNVFHCFVDDIKSNWKLVSLPVLALVLVYALAYPHINYILISAMILLIFFWRYALVIEKKIFRKTVPASKLKEGDVLDDMIWKGLTREEVEQLKKRKESVVIKEGVRFVPVFPITLALTILYGNLLFLFF